MLCCNVILYIIKIIFFCGQADEQARREEAARLEAEVRNRYSSNSTINTIFLHCTCCAFMEHQVLAELNEELESTGSEEGSPTGEMSIFL